MRNDVLSALTLRQSASAVLAVARTTANGQDFWYAHVVEEIVLLEEVGSDGLHRFALAHARDLSDLLVAAAVHPDATDGDGPEVELPVVPRLRAPGRALRALGRAYLRSDVLLLRRDAAAEAPTLTGLFTGPQGSWSVLARPGSQRAWARAESVASLTDRARALRRPQHDPRDGHRGVSALASRMSDVAEAVRALEQRLTSGLDTTEWVGPDRARFESDWRSRHVTALRQAAEALDDAAHVALDQVHEQDSASR